jgi:hypothetical protein
VRALLAAAVAAGALALAYLALGGGDFAPSAVADPCAPRERAATDPTERAALAVLDGAACELGATREDVLLALLDRRAPEGVSDARLGEALQAGIARARREGALGEAEAGVLALALRLGGAQALLDLLLER